jgi:outer membrane lipoprotein LolB
MSRSPRSKQGWRFCCVLPMLLAGCITLPVARQPLDPVQQRGYLQGLETFSFTGRVRVASNGQDSSASIEWAQRRNEASIRLTSQLRVGGVRIRFSPERLQLETSDGMKHRDGEAEQLLARELGFVPPFASLRHWVLGLPSPGSPVQLNADAGNPQQLEGQDWQITYEQDMEVPTAAGAVRLPRILIATRDGLRLRLVIDRWQMK